MIIIMQIDTKREYTRYQYSNCWILQYVDTAASDDFFKRSRVQVRSKFQRNLKNYDYDNVHKNQSF